MTSLARISWTPYYQTCSLRPALSRTGSSGNTWRKNPMSRIKPIAKSRFSVEVVSSEAGRPWMQFERSLIAETASIHRFLVCLEWEKTRFVRMSEELEARVTRIDMSGGRSCTMPTATMDQWMKQAADTRCFATADFFYRCYELGERLRSLLSGRPKRHPIFSCLDSYRFNVQCQKLRLSER